MHWFPEGGGGADRYFHGLVLELVKHDTSVRAYVFGDGQTGQAGSQIRFLGSRKQSLPRRFRELRKEVAGEISRGSRPVLIASHFALYGFPLLDVLWRNAHVVHFHGPWADEAAAEGESGRAVFFKHGIERAIYASARRFVVLSRAFRDVLGPPLRRAAESHRCCARRSSGGLLQYGPLAGGGEGKARLAEGSGNSGHRPAPRTPNGFGKFHRRRG